MILVDELVVYEEYRNLCTAEEQDEEHNKGESEHVVVLVHPETRHDEEELNVCP